MLYWLLVCLQIAGSRGCSALVRYISVVLALPIGMASWGAGDDQLRHCTALNLQRLSDFVFCGHGILPSLMKLEQT